MLDGIWKLVQAYSQDKGLVVPLSIAVLVLMYSHFHIWMANRGRLSDKDRHIEDLIGERNRLQTFLFDQQGWKRQSSDREET
jgi:hypothetical protein